MSSPDIQRAYEIAKEFSQRAHAPYSRFFVGAAVLSKDGQVFGGCNVENASFGGTVCAERVALFKAVSEGVVSLSDIVVVTDLEVPAFPCGLCLQVMAEFFVPESRVWRANHQRLLSSHQFLELFPRPFNSSALSESQ